MSEWISVKDRLPELGEMVMLHIPSLGYGDDIRTGYMDRETADGVGDGPPFFFPLGHNAFFALDQVTHWMPLPQPPEGE